MRTAQHHVQFGSAGQLWVFLVCETREKVLSSAELPGKPRALGWKEERAGFIRPLINQQGWLPVLIAPGRSFLLSGIHVSCLGGRVQTRL